MSQSSNAFAQENKFQELSNKMFFNILIHDPDSSVYPFLKMYYPHFTEKPDSSGWTMYADTIIPEFYPVINSFQFLIHPFFDVRFREGQLDVLSNNTMDGQPWSLRDFKLWLFFDNKQEGETAFEKLCSMFDQTSKTKSIFNKGGMKVAQYSETDKIEIVGTVEFVLTEDELHPEKRKLFFRIGALTFSD